MSADWITALESRRLFAAATLPAATPVPLSTWAAITTYPATPPATRLKGGVLYVDGTRNADTLTANVTDGKVSFANGLAGTLTYTTTADGRIVVTRAGSGDAVATGTIRVTNSDGGYVISRVGTDRTYRLIAGPAATSPRYDLSKIKRVVVRTGEGDDTIDLSALTVPAEVYAGGGTDNVSGGQKNDTLYGEAGDDVITDGRGNDVLDGGGGNDLLVSRKGPDTLTGGAGRDTLRSLSAKTVIDGGAGVDTGYLAAAPDSIAGVENTEDSSPLNVTPTTIDPTTYTATLRRDRNTLDLDASVTLPFGGFGVDFDLVKNTTGEAVVGVTLYTPRGLSGQAFTTYGAHFDLGQNLARRSVRVAVTQAGDTVLSGRTYVTPAFDGRTFTASTGDDLADGSVRIGPA